MSFLPPGTLQINYEYEFVAGFPPDSSSLGIEYGIESLGVAQTANFINGSQMGLDM